MKMDLLDALLRLFAWRDVLLGRLFLAFTMILAFVSLGALLLYFAIALSHLTIVPVPAPRVMD